MFLKAHHRRILAWILFLILLVLPSLFITPKASLRSLYPLLLFAAIFNHRRSMILIFTPLVLIMPAALHFWHVYHAPMNASFWLILLGTDVAEAGDFLKQFWQMIIPAWLILILLLRWIWRHSEGPIFVKPKWRQITFILLAVPLFALGKNYSAENIRIEMSHHFSDSYPWSFLMGYMVAEHEIEAYRKVDFNTQWNLHAKADNLLGDQSEVIVLVIGESARRDRHQIFGYNQKTTPEMLKLQADGELLAFTDFISLHPHTATSVPTLMTKSNNLQDQVTTTEVPPSFVQIYKDAGFKTYWISNQAAMGGNENRVSVYARRSDYFHSFHISSVNLPWAYDGQLLPEFFELLKEPQKKKFFVLHLQGSHYGFDKRYPREFGQFSDNYDNTILYTDFILGQIVEKLRSLPVVTAMMYVSDHGLMLGECGQYTHFDMKQSYEVPFYLWTSPQWRSYFSSKYSAALKNTPKKITSLFVLDSLVDLGGLTYENFEPEKSVLQNNLKEQMPRLVKTYSQLVDYDLGQNDKDCHLVAK